MKQVKEVIDLFSIVKKLQTKYPNKNFTLDGRLIGDIGEIIVAKEYDITLYEKQEVKYDGYSSENKKVQIKTTLKNKLTFPYGYNNIPDYYIGIKLNEDGTFEEIYNGPGRNIFRLLEKRQKPKNGYFSISISTLKKENETISDTQKIKRRT